MFSAPLTIGIAGMDTPEKQHLLQKLYDAFAGSIQIVAHDSCKGNCISCPAACPGADMLLVGRRGILDFTPEIPFVAYLAAGDRETTALAAEKGALALIPTTVNPDELRASLTVLLTRKAKPGAHLATTMKRLNDLAAAAKRSVT